MVDLFIFSQITFDSRNSPLGLLAQSTTPPENTSRQEAVDRAISRAPAAGSALGLIGNSMDCTFCKETCVLEATTIQGQHWWYWLREGRNGGTQLGWTHWDRDKMAVIFHTTFSNLFSWMKIYESRLRFHWNLFLGVSLTIFHDWFR